MTDKNENTGHLGNKSDEPVRARGRNADRREYWERDNRSSTERNLDDARQMHSRTFNEDEGTWREERRAKGDTDRNWNESDQMQRSPGRDIDEERRTHGRYNDDEQHYDHDDRRNI
ncbi:hypothetical protein FUA48_17120 [Flavobacterium alkalisoli]|uniref:Uncharacterized protein n=1 Tax=Flavobacterium alkalisoli TaxID=2602769 RepID=A0A5B9FVJ4_9FLAO|nr:hypothetical protein [Flavobacterium alkalisoli]QEE51203.1 hypothetical protein FUA48_16990 [Flavobacterium alkalisoli]QEE51218.1 hypothetical protein FUA48_17105 [Flavobacterium alkalisoli]QEE51221.1 hypothetical protein FUA48_17120 [Flavobacterium alkalisoli]